METNKKVPATVFSGFLGSGKTTIISHLIDHLIEKGIRVAFVKNEIGSEDIDGILFRGKHIVTRELLNGCICCTLTGSFYHALRELVESVRPDRILIEASGAADPSAIALLVSSHPDVYRDGVISVIDVVNFEGYMNLSMTARRQAGFTDLIVFNKVEFAGMDKKSACVGYVRELNEFAPIVEAPGGKLNPALAFGIDSKELENLLNTQAEKNMNIHSHLEEDNIESFSVSIEKNVDEDKLSYFLKNLQPNIIRVKGFIKNSSNKIRLVNKVGIRTVITDAPKIITGAMKLVFIGFGINTEFQEISDKISNLY